MFCFQCNACDEFLHKGKKYNTRKVPAADCSHTVATWAKQVRLSVLCPQETVQGEDYLGLRVVRFYFKNEAPHVLTAFLRMA